MNKNEKYNRSFAARMSRWVILVLLIMMGSLSYLLYFYIRDVLTEVIASNYHSGLRASDSRIADVMSDITVAVKNNIPDIENHLAQPDQVQTVVERIVMQNPSIRSCGVSFIDNYYPQKGHLFCPYAMRNDSMQVEATQLGSAGNDYLSADWFQEALARDSAYWSTPFFNGQDSETPLVAYLCPVRNPQGRVVGILGADLSLDFMTRFLQEQDSIFSKEAWSFYNGGDRSYVISNDGTYVTHPDHRRIQKGNFFVHIKDTDEPDIASKVVNDMKDGKTSNDETEKVLMVNRKESYLFYRPVTGTDWMLVSSVSTSSLQAFGMVAGILFIWIIGLALLVTFLVCYLTIKRTAKPLKLLAGTADKVAQGQFDTPLPTIKHDDEICQLRDSFENMQHSLTAYIEDLKATTTAKASIENELKIAHGIQMSMLPKTYPAFPHRDDIDIFGQVTPAKAVGGDLYDFFIRDEKLFFCIGDVSGKGVPASLVMAVTRSLFRNIAAHTTEPNHMVKGINESLSENNETNMFVTLFIGVIDLATGVMNYSNAGHDMPLLLADGEVILLECDSNIPAGVMPDWEYTCQQIQIHPGSTIFLYTDGLNEAEDISHQQFGMERVMETAKAAGNVPQDLIAAMTSAVKQFVGEAEQSDDLTMFAIQVRDKSKCQQ